MDGAFPARVDVVGGVIDNGMGGSLFSNDGGVLVLDQLTVANITSAVSVHMGPLAHDLNRRFVHLTLLIHH